MYELDGKYFSDAVYRKFGENVVVPGVGLTVVYPLNDYVRATGRNLTPHAQETAAPCEHMACEPVMLCMDCGKYFD